MDYQDLFSDIFLTLRLKSHLYFHAQFRGNTAVEVPRERQIIRFHLVRSGQCYLRVPGYEPVLLKEGHIAIIPEGESQHLYTSLEASPVPLPEVITQYPIKQGKLDCGQGDIEVSLLCGYCSFDESIEHPVLNILPAMLVLAPETLRHDARSATALKLLSLESEHEAPGVTSILSRMLEIILIQAVRQVSYQTGNSRKGFLAAINDPKLYRALRLIHEAPQRSWTIDKLAREAGMSRARFADRFTEIIGTPPISYLTQWRLMKSRALLTTTGLGMEEIANRCGYASASSFSRRFTEAFGIGPGAYRKQN